MTQTFARNHSHYGAFTAIVEDGRVVGVRPFEHDPDPSQLIEAIPDAVHSPTRIAQPMVREGWLRHGPGSGAGRGQRGLRAGVVGRGARPRRGRTGAGQVGAWQRLRSWAARRAGPRPGSSTRRGSRCGASLSSFGGFVDQTSNYSFGAALTFLPHILGSPQAVSGPVTSWSSIAKHTRLMVMFGGANPKNTQVAKGGCAYHAISGWIEQLDRAGVAIVNISPMREDGPGAVAPEWIAIRPNTDTAMMLALAHTLVTEDLHDRDFLARYCTGFERVLPYLMGATDGVAERRRLGVAHHRRPRRHDPRFGAAHGGLAHHAHRVLVACSAPIMASSLTGRWCCWRRCLGQIGLAGRRVRLRLWLVGQYRRAAAAIPRPGDGGAAQSRRPRHSLRRASRIVCCNRAGATTMTARAATYPDIRLVYWAGGNPFHHHQDLNRLRRAWRRPETVVVHEPWWTATARHADIVLPATTSLERNDLGCAARDRFVIAMHKAIPPVGEARDDFSILRDLSQRLGCENAFTEGRDEDGWVRRIYDVFRERARSNLVPEFDEFWEKGWLEIPRRGEEYVLMEDFRADPERHRLHTPSGKIELYSERIAGFGYDDCPPHPTWIEPAEWLGAQDAGEYPLHLVSSQPRYRLHSQMDAGPVSALGKIDGREAVALNRADARVRGIAPGDVVRVYNDRGACFAGAVLSDDVRPGVVKLSCGAWYDPESGADDAACAHGNANVLTRDHGTSRLGQGPSSATALVEVERWSGDAPPVRAFVPPESNQGRPA